jgi:hypothetical protein
MNNLLHCFHLFNFSIGILQFILGIYEVIILNKYDNDNLNIAVLISFKAIINLIYGSISIISIFNIIKQNNITKYYNNFAINIIYFVNCSLSIWNFVEFCTISNLSRVYKVVIFLEFLLFQLVGSIYISLLCASYRAFDSSGSERTSEIITTQINNITIINANIITELNQETDIYNIINIEQQKIDPNDSDIESKQIGQTISTNIEHQVIEITAIPVQSETVEAFPFYDDIYH